MNNIFIFLLEESVLFVFPEIVSLYFFFLLEESVLFVFPEVVSLYFYIPVGRINPICFSRSCVPLFLYLCWGNQSYLFFQELCPFIFMFLLKESVLFVIPGVCPFFIKKKMYAGYMRSIDNVHV